MSNECGFRAQAVENWSGSTKSLKYHLCSAGQDVSQLQLTASAHTLFLGDVSSKHLMQGDYNF